MGWRTASKPLSTAYIRAVITELEQTAVAVSVMGTTKRKLGQMADLVGDVVVALVGTRPEIKRVRLSLVQLMHDVRVSATVARPASDALRRLAGGLRRVQGLVVKGYDGAESEFDVAEFQVVNSWGYTPDEASAARVVLAEVSRRLTRVGLPELASGEVYLDPREASSFVGYRREDGALVMDLDRAGTTWDVYYALGMRLWDGFRGSSKEVWGGSSGDDRFCTAFADLLDEKKPSRDALARLEVTLGIAA